MLDGFLRHTTEKHQQDSTLDFVVAVDGGKEALDKVIVQVDVLRHRIDTIPILFRHLVLDLDSSHFFLMQILTAKLVGQIIHLKTIFQEYELRRMENLPSGCSGERYRPKMPNGS